MYKDMMDTIGFVSGYDPELGAAMQRELGRQQANIELIASENFVYNASLLDAEVRLMEKYKSEELAKHYSTQLDQLYNEYVTRMKGK